MKLFIESFYCNYVRPVRLPAFTILLLCSTLNISIAQTSVSDFTLPEYDSNNWENVGTGIDFPDGYVRDITSYHDDIYFGGSFSASDENQSGNLLRFNVSSGEWFTVGGGVEVNDIYSLLQVDDDLYVGGSFTEIGGIEANNIARFNLVNETWHALGDGLNGTVHIVISDGDKLYAGGEFTHAGDKSTGLIAGYNLTGQTWFELGDPLSRSSGPARVNGLGIRGNELFACGFFNHAGDMSLPYVGRMNLSDETWDTMNTENADVNVVACRTLAVMDKGLFLSGSIAGPSWAGYAGFFFESETWTDMNTSATEDEFTSHAMYDFEGYLFSGNKFLNVFSPEDQSWENFGTAGILLHPSDSDTGLITSLQYHDGYIYAGGNFDRIGYVNQSDQGIAVNNVARYKLLSSSTNSVKEEELPEEISLHQNYPNPFNPSTKIVYSIDQYAHVQLTVFDVLGRQVAVLVNELQVAGSYSVSFDASSISSGIYIYQLQAGDRVIKRHMSVIK